MLPEYRKILYATDLSENARAAFKHAVSFAKTYKAKIFLLHVVPTLQLHERELIMASSGFGANVPDMISDEEKMKEVTAEIVEKIRGRLKRFAEEELGGNGNSLDWLGSIEVLEGASPTEEILSASERLDVDLLVFGSHSKGVLKQTFLGSVAEKVLERTCRPFLVVPLVD
jgi:nucleotide-binding universal stress UspA family protein